MSVNVEKVEALKSRMKILAILSNALELLSGEWAKTVCWIAGKRLGENVNVGEKSSLEDVFSVVSPWKVEVFEKKNDNEYLVIFRECPIRQTHYVVCTKQGNVMCQITHGYITQVIAKALKKNVKLVLLHAGPNACLKKVVIEK